MSKYLTIESGSCRAVVLVHILGIVIKFPIIRINSAAEDIVFDIRTRRWKNLWQFCTNPPSHLESLSYLTLRGIITNWQEYRFWKKTRHQFLWPTPFSFFGLFNIQSLGRNNLPSNTKIWKIFVRITRDVWNDGHTFSDPENFTLAPDGTLRIIDYGSKECQKIILKHSNVFAALSGPFV